MSIIKKLTKAPETGYKDVNIARYSRKGVYLSRDTKECLSEDSFTLAQQKEFMSCYVHAYNLLKSKLLFHPQMDTAIELMTPDNKDEAEKVLAPRYATLAHNIAWMHVKEWSKESLANVI